MQLNTIILQFARDLDAAENDAELEEFLNHELTMETQPIQELIDLLNN